MKYRVIPAAAALLLVIAPSVRAQPEGANETDALLRQLMERLERVEQELERMQRREGTVPADAERQKLHVLLETPFLGRSYYGGENNRFFAARLLLINLTPKEVLIERNNVRVSVAGKDYGLKEIPRQLQYQSVQVGNESLPLRNFTSPEQVRIPSGGTASLGLVLTDLPQTNDVPRIIVKLPVGETPTEFDVNRFALGQLGLEVERIGPRGSLGLLTISGTINTINVGGLVEALEDLAAEKVARVVIRWTGSAAPLDSVLASWLQQTVAQAGTGRRMNNNGYLPAIPASIRELHVAQLPDDPENRRRSGSSNQTIDRFHKTGAEAVSAALRSAYEILPRDELVREIESGHPLTQAAALSGGGGRLPSDKLPLLLSFAEHDDPRLQAAAIEALRHFGEPAAIDTLVRFAMKGKEPLASAAIESLAASRYSVAHEALTEILHNEPAASKKKIVSVLARYPRPVWSEIVYEYATDPNSGMGLDALRALGAIGHPKLFDVLKSSLESNDEAIRNEAFGMLVKRADAESEELAMQFTLEHLKTKPPTPEMHTLLSRTRDPRAVPLLVKQFEEADENQRARLIGLLAQVGDESVAALFVEKY
ncbi:MAG: HEAT repeat domain-containing protein, partial [Planctomycetaceae bacterium]